MALIAIQNKQLIGTYDARLCMLIKVLQPLNSNLVSSLAVISDMDMLIRRKVFLLVLEREVVLASKDNK